MIKLTDVRYMLIVLSAVFAVGLGLLMALQIERSRSDTIQDGFHDAQNMAINLAQHTRQSFLALDLVLQSITSTDLLPMLTDPAQRDRGYRVLRHRKEVLQGVVDILVLDPAGRLVLSSNTPDPQPLDLSAQPAFVAARDHTVSGMTISPAIIAQGGPAKGKYVLVLSRAITANDGKFLGTVIIVLGLDYFQDFYNRLSIGPHGVLGIVRGDGIIILRHPDLQNFVGKSVAGLDVFTAYTKNPTQGELYQRGLADSYDRIMAYRDVPDVNLFVVVGLSVDDVLASWRRSMMTETIAAAALFIIVLLLAGAANRLLSTREAERERTIARLNHLAQTSAEIATAHSEEQLAGSVDRVIQYLIPGGRAVLHLTKDPDRQTTVASSSHIVAPMRNKSGGIIGAIAVNREEGPDLNQQDAAVLTQLAHVVAVAIENLELLAHSQTLAVQAERARGDEAEARRAMETVFATMSEAVCVLDPEGYVTFLNANAERLLHRPKTELLGNIMWDAIPALRGTIAHKNFVRCFKEQKTVEFEFSAVNNGVTRWTDVRAFPSKDGITIYTRDITPRVETEAKLRQAQKMEAIGQLTGGMAHDFNNLLTVVLGSADTLVDALVGNAMLRRVAESIRDSALRGATLVARLLAFARRQALAPESVDVNELIGGLEDLLTRTIGENIRIRIIRGADLWHASIDPVQMENAILNLALNARDAMTGGGTLIIETRNERLDADTRSFEQIESGEYVMVTVSDTGSGMSEDVLQRAFDPFFTTKPIGQGSGLGLSMVYGFVRQSGGQVRISSAPGQGTSVRIYLPRAASMETAAAHLEQDNMPLGHERILLVEDDELVRAHLAETLASLGYAVTPCGSGQEVLAMIKSGVEADLLLTDIILAGGMNGHRVAEQIKELRPAMPVLYMSGYTENAIAGDGQLDPGIHFISKPFRRQQIATKLRAVFAA